MKAHHVEYNCFYIPDITSLVDIQEDYLKWFLNKAEIVSIGIICVSFSGYCAKSINQSLTHSLTLSFAHTLLLSLCHPLTHTLSH